MKLKKVIVLIVIVFSIINIKSTCYAKYIYEYTKKAAEITIINN